MTVDRSFRCTIQGVRTDNKTRFASNGRYPNNRIIDIVIKTATAIPAMVFEIHPLR